MNGSSSCLKLKPVFLSLAKVIATTLSLFLVFLVPQSGFSQEQNSSLESAGIKKDPKKQTLSFEDELVQGSTQKPELFFLFQKKNFNYKRLIRLRENFLPEMRRSSEDLHRRKGPPE